MKTLLLAIVMVFVTSSALARTRVLVLGDSMTFYHGSYGYQLKRFFPTDVVAKDGASTSWIWERFKQKNLSRYSHLIVLAGLVDVNGVRFRQAKHYLSKIYKRARKHHLRVVAITIPPANGWRYWNAKKQSALIKLNNWIRRQSRGLVVDFYKLVGDRAHPKQLALVYAYPDKLHPNKKAHKVLTRRILKKF